MSEIVSWANGRAIVLTHALFGSGFNVYRPPEDVPPFQETIQFSKENDPMSIFTTLDAAAAWASRRPPLEPRAAQVAAECQEKWEKHQPPQPPFKTS